MRHCSGAHSPLPHPILTQCPFFGGEALIQLEGGTRLSTPDPWCLLWRRPFSNSHTLFNVEQILTIVLIPSPSTPALIPSPILLVAGEGSKIKFKYSGNNTFGFVMNDVFAGPMCLTRNQSHGQSVVVSMPVAPPVPDCHLLPHPHPTMVSCSNCHAAYCCRYCWAPFGHWSTCGCRLTEVCRVKTNMPLY